MPHGSKIIRSSNHSDSRDMSGGGGDVSVTDDGKLIDDIIIVVCGASGTHTIVPRTLKYI